ncbi:hypothetical protein [Streptomyces sp. NPDC006668]|uniref:hypothetical protein n=1 Tax=Streptomyces sp. NPDC006668 TaxID=3156903 RepID=UPI0033D1C967
MEEGEGFQAARGDGAVERGGRRVLVGAGEQAGDEGAWPATWRWPGRQSFG